MLFSLSNPLLFCTRVLRNHERREGAILLTERLLIWLENCTLSNDKRSTIEFGYSFAYSLLYIRKLVILQQSGYARISLGTPQDPEIMSLIFDFHDKPTLDAVTLVKERAQQLFSKVKAERARTLQQQAQPSQPTTSGSE